MLADRLRTARVIGPRQTFNLVLRRLVQGRAQAFHRWNHLFAAKRGLEIGGPSALFEGRAALPLYPLLREVDNCVFAANTAWLSHAEVGQHFRYERGRRIGYQYICDGTDLASIANRTYDCVLSCNNLEHIANPLKALHEWMRVLTDDGVMILVVPAQEYTFDHRRPVTTLAHLVADFQSNVGEEDLSHLDEVLSLHDLGRDRAAGPLDDFRQRCQRNVDFRCMHHHVFDGPALSGVMEYASLKVLAVEYIAPLHLAAIAKKR